MKHSTYIQAFLMLLVVTIFSATILSYLLIRYATDDSSHWFNALTTYKFSVKNQKNDVLFIGDSALLMGVMPLDIEKKFGITSINLGLVGYSGPLVFDLLTDTYLRNNSRPKLIVLYLAAATPYYFNECKYEKTFPFVKYAPLEQLTKHLDQVGILDLLGAARSVLSDTLQQLKSRKTQEKTVLLLETTKGFSPNTSNPLPQKNEDSFLREGKELNLSYLEEFKKKYASSQTKVLVYLAPMPMREKSFSFFAGKYSGVSDNQPVQLPDEYFVDANHMNPRGAAYNSRLLGEFIVHSGAL